MELRLRPEPDPVPEGGVGGAWHALRTAPSAVLLLVQLAGVLLYPFLVDLSIGPWEGAGRSLLGLFGLLVLGLAVLAVRATPALTWVSVVAGAPAAVLTVLEGFRPDQQWVVLTSAGFHAVFYLYTGYALIRYMFNDTWVTSDELWATGAAFTVVAWGWAYVYVLVQAAWPGSFSGAVAPEGPRTFFDLLFLSFTVLTSTGLSDIVPLLPHARAVVMIEQVAGMLYLAVVVARIVGLTIIRQR
ncbi:potassium channel family protein [Lapillicoccus jejuensis]|uniref:Ion channel n=1 Tax=Lapillicoccus jejuensis TaxID=402171 RepID=A0A542E439_9MICO|nr:potassium channel family protein [Lapillicoccus jejuensis]TQJ10059.1 ion channel [Lapillicoccus jejuensis]